jgi:hypothetical protein
MVHEMDCNSSDSLLRVVGTIIPTLPLLVYLMIREYLCFKTSANKAGKIFHNELLAQGMSPGLAEDLTNFYLESRDLFRFFS